MALAFGAVRHARNASMASRVGGLVASRQPRLHHVPVRFLNLHEYQSKELMAKFNVRVQHGYVANNEQEAREASETLKKQGAEELVVKAQIHAGGRGKGHFDTGFKKGVHIRAGENRVAEIAEAARQMFGHCLITKQTGPAGQKVLKVLIHEGISFDREMYFAILMDRAHNGPVMVASTQGGMDIEEVAHSNPEAIFTQPIDIEKGVQPSDTEKVARVLGFKGQELVDVQEQMANLYKLFIASDATQVEINPLVVTKNGKVYCVDAKITFDDNAEFRQKPIYALRDTTMEDPREVEASKSSLNYIGLDGNIGCMVNGAGLAMATMDIIQLHGGKPANFLDVGGGANAKQVEEAFKLLQSDPNVKALLVNIFGGIMKCDVIAEGIITAAKNVGLKVPLVVRLEGTNVQLGLKLLQESGLPIITATDLDDAAIKAVKAISK
jgi:succinyl-CoA synthetase beta subunit